MTAYRNLPGIGALKRCRPFVPSATLQSIYNALVQPHFDYCSVIWGNSATSLYSSWDLNLDRLRPEDKEVQLLLNLQEVYGLECLITKPTRVTPTSATDSDKQARTLQGKWRI